MGISDVGRDLVCGTASGSLASLAGHPLDTVRVRMQTLSHLGYGTMITTARRTVLEEGVFALYRGALPPILGTGPRNAIAFACHGYFLSLLEPRQQMLSSRNSSSSSSSTLITRRTASLANVALAGSLTGAVQCFVIVPTDRLKIMMQVQGASGSGVGRTQVVSKLMETARHIVSEAGWRSLFQGATVTLLRTSFSAIWYFTTYEMLKRAGEQRLQGSSGHREGGGALSYVVTLIAGGSAGVVSTLSSHPFDVVKSVVQAQSKPCTMVQALASLREVHGPWMWAWKGLFPSLVRGGVINAVNFLVYEKVAEMLG